MAKKWLTLMNTLWLVLGVGTQWVTLMDALWLALMVGTLRLTIILRKTAGDTYVDTETIFKSTNKCKENQHT